MPLYEYECSDCAVRFERIQKFSDPIVKTCPTCGGPVQKLPSSPAIKFKGTGWYINDYAKKPTAERPDGDKQESSSSKGDKESKPSEKSTSTETKKTTEPKQKSTSS